MQFDGDVALLRGDPDTGTLTEGVFICRVELAGCAYYYVASWPSKAGWFPGTESPDWIEVVWST